MISDDYKELNRQLHALRPDYGASGHKWADAIRDICVENGYHTVLDYGAGKGSFRLAMRQAAPALKVREYDPCVEGKDGEPDPADIVVCTDVLEHIEPKHLDAVLTHIRLKALHRVFLVIATRPAKKTLPDGRNAHLIQQGPAWWRAELEKHFQIAEWFEGPGAAELLCTGVPIREVGAIPTKGAVSNDKRLENTRANISVVTNRVEGIQAHQRRAIVACYGPSLKDSLDRIRAERLNTGAVVVSVSGAHDFLIQNGIIPDYHIECDPRPHKGRMVTPHAKVKYLLASCCDPEWVAKMAAYDTGLWHLCNGEESLQIWDVETKAELVMGGGSVGNRSITLLYHMGYRNYSVYGMDCSFSEDGEQHAGAHSGKRQHEMKVRCGEQWFRTSAVLITYARHFLEWAGHLPDANIALNGNGLLLAMAREGMRQAAINNAKEKAA